jgi:hypothetical protein
MDRDPRLSPDKTVPNSTASGQTIWADYFNLGGGVETNTGSGSRPGKIGDY